MQALRTAADVLSRSPSDRVPLLIMMSDGDGSGGDSEMSSIRSAHSSRGLQVHTIAFGSGANSSKLQSLATTGGGTFHSAATGMQLVDTFKSIAKAGALKDELMDQFAKEVGKLLTDKLVLDYL